MLDTGLNVSVKGRPGIQCKMGIKAYSPASGTDVSIKAGPGPGTVCNRDAQLIKVPPIA